VGRLPLYDPWSGTDTTSNVNCPTTTRVGDSYAGVARPGELAPAVTRLWPVFILVCGLVLAFPD